MINSNLRKLALSGWLKKNDPSSYNTPLKLQKFLFFYESFSKISGDKSDFNSLKGYKKDFKNIDDTRAKKCSFLVQTLTEKELSDLTHKLNLWKSKESRIMNGEYQVELDEEDFNMDDVRLIKMLESMYSIEIIEDSIIIPIDAKKFVISKEDAKKLSTIHYDILVELSEKEELHNPIFIEIDEEERLIID